MKYISLTHTTENKLSDGRSWIEYYCQNLDVSETSNALLSLYICPVCGDVYTDENPVVGAHVARICLEDLQAYIIPMCNSCNREGGIVEVNDKLPIVAVPKNSPHYRDIRYPSDCVRVYKMMASARLSSWNGRAC